MKKQEDSDTIMARKQIPSNKKTKHNTKNKKDIWYKLDLSAIVYPTLDMTLPRFPTYKVAIRKGLFWRYLEPNNRPGPYVRKDIKNPCMPMHFKGSNRYLIRIYYYENRIALEAH